MSLRARCGAAFAVLLAVSVPVGAVAAQLELSPIRLSLSAASPIGVIVVSNPGVDPSIVQVQLFDWRQEGGNDVLVPSRDVLVNPAIFRIGGGSQQIVRFGLQQAEQRPVEGSYRVS